MERTPIGSEGSRLPHERLDVYQVAREILAFVAERRNRFRGLPGELAGHLEKSSVSTLLNIAEAAGRTGIRDRRARFAIARGEACEVAAALEAAALLGAIDDEEWKAAREMILRVTRMLDRLTR